MTVPVVTPGQFLFPTPDTPDLGCHVASLHGFEEDYDFHIWSETSPVVQGDHQVYFRVRCGEAAFYQRCNVYMADQFVPPGFPPDFVLGGAFAPAPSDWQRFAPQSRARQYHFHGEHRPPSSSSWRWDAAVGHSFDQYDNGTLSVVGWDDTGGDRDFNDLTVEIAVVDRTGYFDVLAPAEVLEAKLQRFSDAILPGYLDRHPVRHADARDQNR